MATHTANHCNGKSKLYALLGGFRETFFFPLAVHKCSTGIRHIHGDEAWVQV